MGQLRSAPFTMLVRIARSVLLCLALILPALIGPPAPASADGTWSTPQWIPGLVDSDPSQYPFFVTDPSGTVHVIHSQWVDGSFSILYSQWKLEVGWTQPVDIFRPGIWQARVTGAFLDEMGMLNVIFWGGDELRANMYFIQAPLETAGKAATWSKALLIGQNATSPTNAAVVSDGKGWIMAVYSGNRLGNGLYGTISTDGGQSWSAPDPFFFTSSDTFWATDLRLKIGVDNRVDAVWALGDLTGNSRAVYYANFDASTRQWTKAHVLAEPIDYEADTPNIIEHNGELIVIYHNGSPTTRWMIRSFDQGKTWAPATRLFEQIGSNGSAELVVDSADRLHLFFGNRVGNPAIHGLWHSVWQDGSWSTPEAIVSGPQILGGLNGEEGFDPSTAQAVVSRGNLMLVIWRHDPMAGPTHIWYSYAYLDAPQLPAATLPPVPTKPAEEGGFALSATKTPTPVPTFIGEVPEEELSSSMNNMLLFGVVPAVFLVFVMILIIRKER